MKHLRPIDKFAPSQNPYWFNVWSRDDCGLHAASIDAVWFGRKKSLTVVTSGLYRLYATDARGLSTRALIEAADTRYGGTWRYRWDGNQFQRNPDAPLSTPAELSPVLERLQAWLDTPPSGDGWVGPYYNTDPEEPQP